MILPLRSLGGTFGQISHVADRGHYVIVLAEILINGLRLGGRFHNDELFSLDFLGIERFLFPWCAFGHKAWSLCNRGQCNCLVEGLETWETKRTSERLPAFVCFIWLKSFRI